MTPTDPGSADPMQYSNNFTSYIYAPAFVPPTTPISTAGVQQVNKFLWETYSKQFPFVLILAKLFVLLSNAYSAITYSTTCCQR